MCQAYLCDVEYNSVGVHVSGIPVLGRVITVRIHHEGVRMYEEWVQCVGLACVWDTCAIKSITVYVHMYQG